MRQRAPLPVRQSARTVSGWPRMALLAAVLLVFPLGCDPLRDVLDEKPAAEIALQNPPAYGVVEQVASAAMADRENRKGDIILTIELEDGQVIMVIQPEDDVYTPGDRVRILRDGKGFVRAQLL